MRLRLCSGFRSFLIALLFAAAGVGAEPVTVTGYLIGSPPAGLQAVLDAVNRKLGRDVNARLLVNYVGWNELNSKYPLVLAGGEDLDFIYTADWAPYTTQAVRGAFRQVTEDELRRLMPRHWAATSPDSWAQARVNGRLYMIPTATPDRKVPVALVRGDLRRQFGLAPLRSVRDLEPYLEAVKTRQPGLTPINLGNGYDIGQPFFGLLNADIPPVQAAFFGSVYGNFEDPGRSLVDLLDDTWRPAFTRAAATMKRWYDRGYLNRAPFANPVLSKDSFAAGRSAVGFGNSQDVQNALAIAQAKGYEPEIIPLLSRTGHAPQAAATGNGVAVAAGSKNAELTLKVLDLLMEDPAYGRLVSLGIEGVHYRLDEEGRAALAPGLTPEANPYPIEAAGFWFVNKDRLPPLASWSPAYRDHRQALGGYLVPNAFRGFTFVPQRVKNAIAAITTVMDQYWAPLAIGAVNQVPRAVETLRSKLQAAGQPEALAELRRQLGR